MNIFEQMEVSDRKNKIQHHRMMFNTKSNLVDARLEVILRKTTDRIKITADGLNGAAQVFYSLYSKDGAKARIAAHLLQHRQNKRFFQVFRNEKYDGIHTIRLLDFCAKQRSAAF